ncbi:MAG: threonine synthase [Acidimicrobiia bacterium]|nr:MAG: threonine synthase [Acidimicrobiia bacterium]
MTAYQGHLVCPRCGTEVEESAFMFGCPVCAAEGVPVNVHPAYELISGSWDLDPSAPGLFGRRGMLPLPEGGPVVSLGEGHTPLLHLERTGARLGLSRLYLKDETQNPTWSYKDRLAAVATTKALNDGADTVVVATTGNHGAATAAYAAAAGIRCVALTLASVPLTMKVLMQAYGAEVVALDRPADRWSLMRLAVEQWGWVPLSGLVDPPIGSNPFGIDGYKSIAYELYGQLGAVPDVVVVPTAYADGLTGIYRGFADLLALGRSERLPRMVAAEPLGPFAASLIDGGDVPATTQPRSSVAFSIAGSVATYQGVRVLRHSGGEAVVVGDDEEIIAAQLTLAADEGLYLEAASVTAIPAVKRLVGEGLVAEDDVIVTIGTSTGLKDVQATAARLDDVPVIEPTLAALGGRLRDG